MARGKQQQVINFHFLPNILDFLKSEQSESLLVQVLNDPFTNIFSNEEARQSLLKSCITFLKSVGSFIDMEISKVPC